MVTDLYQTVNRPVREDCPSVCCNHVNQIYILLMVLTGDYLSLCYFMVSFERLIVPHTLGKGATAIYRWGRLIALKITI